MTVISGAERARLFGAPGHVPKVQVKTPWGIVVYCHELVAPVFLSACKDAAACKWKPLRIDSYNSRPIRGEDGDQLDEWSLHSWALAWDFFATPPDVPPPGGVWTPDNAVPADFAACFADRGFRWGATFKRRDVPHIEWPGGRPTRAQEAAHPSDLEPAAVAVTTPLEDDDMVRIMRFVEFGDKAFWVVDFGAGTRWQVPDPAGLTFLRTWGVKEITGVQPGGTIFREIPEPTYRPAG